MTVETTRPVRPVERELFRDAEANVFAILDGASVPRLLEVMNEHDPERVCLYRGDLQPDVAEVAPYLIRLERNSEFTNYLLSRGWGQHWGVFAVSEADLATLRRHLRGFLIVHDPDGKPLYFRYYDPRVLRVYLPTCNADELKQIFGPISTFLLEGEDPGVLLRFRVVREQLVAEQEPLTTDVRNT